MIVIISKKHIANGNWLGLPFHRPPDLFYNVPSTPCRVTGFRVLMRIFPLRVFAEQYGLCGITMADYAKTQCNGFSRTGFSNQIGRYSFRFQKSTGLHTLLYSTLVYLHVCGNLINPFSLFRNKFVFSFQFSPFI